MKQSKKRKIEEKQSIPSTSKKYQSRSDATNIEEIFLRFPDVSGRILNHLSDKSLVTLKGTGRKISCFIEGEKM